MNDFLPDDEYVNRPPDPSTDEDRTELDKLLAALPEARPFVESALKRGAWVGNCLGAMRQWAMGHDDHAKEIMEGWVRFWKGWPDNEHNRNMEALRQQVAARLAHERAGDT